MKRGHSRGIDKTTRTAVDQDIIDKGGRKSATNRAQNRGPDPVLTTIIEDCIKNGLGTLTEQLGINLRTIAVMMRGPRSRAGLMAPPTDELLKRTR